jgi:short-subunit dehydrogenase involved in D-alanine esterification of teichoic acids
MNILYDIISSRKAVNAPLTKKDINIVTGRKERIENELKRAKQAYLSEVFDLTEYSELKNRLEAELKDILVIQNDEGTQSKIKHELLLTQLKNVLESFEATEDINEKRNILLKVIKEIKISPNNIEIVYL